MHSVGGHLVVMLWLTLIVANSSSFRRSLISNHLFLLLVQSTLAVTSYCVYINPPNAKLLQPVTKI